MIILKIIQIFRIFRYFIKYIINMLKYPNNIDLYFKIVYNETNMKAGVNHE